MVLNFQIVALRGCSGAAQEFTHFAKFDSVLLNWLPPKKTPLMRDSAVDLHLVSGCRI